MAGRRASVRALAWWLAAATAAAWLPLLSVVLASVVAELAGCTVNEAAATPCLVGGRDIGGVLVTMFVLGWLMLVTAPFMVATLVGWVLLWQRWRRERAAA